MPVNRTFTRASSCRQSTIPARTRRSVTVPVDGGPSSTSASLVLRGIHLYIDFGSSDEPEGHRRCRREGRSSACADTRTGALATVGVCPGCWSSRRFRPVLLAELAEKGLAVVHGADGATGSYRGRSGARTAMSARRRERIEPMNPDQHKKTQFSIFYVVAGLLLILGLQWFLGGGSVPGRRLQRLQEGAGGGQGRRRSPFPPRTSRAR